MRIADESAVLMSLSQGFGPLAGFGPEFVIEYAGRIAYQSQPKGDPESFIDMLKSKKPTPHLAVLEFGWAAVDCITDRGITHECVRQRLCSFVQESTRWCNYAKGKFGNEITVICPPELRACREGTHAIMDALDVVSEEDAIRVLRQHANGTGCEQCQRHLVWREAMLNAEQAYLRLQGLNTKPQFSRSVLPTSTKAQIAIAGNFRQWWEVILPLRAHSTAHPQLMRLCRDFIFPQLAAAVPAVFGDWKNVLRAMGEVVP